MWYQLTVRSRTLPPASLCIAPGKAVWAIYIDVVCINYDGNAFDAAVLAVMAALKNSELTASVTTLKLTSSSITPRELQ